MRNPNWKCQCGCTTFRLNFNADVSLTCTPDGTRLFLDDTVPHEAFCTGCGEMFDASEFYSKNAELEFRAPYEG